MKFATFVPRTASADSTVGHIGAVLDDETVVDLTAARQGDHAFASMLAFLDAGTEGLERAREIATSSAHLGENKSTRVSLEDVRCLAPIPRPRKNVFCVGLNYPSHVAANAAALGIRAEIGEVPLFFTKPPTAVIGPEASIVHDSRLTAKLDYEVELAIVIGRGGTWIDETRALDHVFGYTLINDVSAREIQWRTSQMFIGKGLDTYCPMGPWIVERAELGEASNVHIGCRVNGEDRQRDSTSSLIFGIAHIVAELSRGLSLEPGDVIATGTPGGCGYQLVPPRFLAPGDVVECWAEGIGVLRNPVTNWAQVA
jgi:2-keto-4-pentenoate hydratase/2-oxohepta-3-ene-1,7-dioic acid hydratase in catechol pathway